MAHASYVASARAMALGAPPLAWFCAAQWPDFTPPLTFGAVVWAAHPRTGTARAPRDAGGAGAQTGRRSLAVC